MKKIIVKNSGVIKLSFVDGNPRGHLYIAESLRHIPFAIKRVYFVNNLNRVFIHDTEGKGAMKELKRGEHAHKKLEQVIFCINGHMTLDLDDGQKKQSIVLDNPSIGVHLGPMLWHSMGGFSPNCVMLVLASGYYNEKDYVRDYSEFKKLAGKKK
jgi:dTDP-4-dehydrorhamnose 3,5-epimerase-like enzyme